jgi:para-nitrobenzyl esterase
MGEFPCAARDFKRRKYFMRFHSRSILGLAVLAASLAVVGSAQDTVSVQTGKIKGVSSDGLIAFKGIPYAAPPVGDLRWRPPQPAAKWKGVRSAADYAHDCMQLPFPSDAAPLGTPPAEDCLYLNVWVPAPRIASPMPVMVWIYGGGFVNGGSSPAVYDGSQFAKDGVVFVSFNYRLGRFGFFGHPALTKESTDRLLGNYTYLDQIAALKWVRANIAAFGGDSNNVTVFGESAGGGSVHMLLTSPLAKGLFQKAIVESGGGRKGFSGGSPHLSEEANGKPSAEATGVAFAASKGITGDDAEALKKLRALPADAIVDNLNMASMMQAAKTYPGPMIDGKIVTGENSDIYLAGTQQHIPVIVGPTNDPFAQFGDKADAARAAYDPDHTRTVGASAAAIMSDRAMAEPARFVVSELSKAGQPAYEYRFSYVATSMHKDWAFGAVHASEIPYVFDTVKARYGAAVTPEDEKAAQTIHAYWVQFAKTGNLNPPGLPAWPQYSASTDMLMNFNATGAAPEADPWKARLDIVMPQP